MMRNLIRLIGLVFVMLLLAGCGEASIEVSPTSTDPPPDTPTPVPPTPTPTPTPIPYDLDISVLDEEGNPVLVGDVIVAGESHPIGENGIVSLKDLPGDFVDLSIEASGYHQLSLPK